MKHYIQICGFIFVLILKTTIGKAQLVTSIENVDQLVQTHLSESGSTISNIVFYGHYEAIGHFNGVNTDLGLSSGIILTTGRVNSNETGPLGPNTTTSAGFLNSASGLNTVNQWLKDEHDLFESLYDVAILKFDIVTNEDKIKFNYVFGSEEYHDFVGFQFSDLLSIFIEGPGLSAPVVNMAKVPGTTTPVNVSTINRGYSSSCSTGPGVNEQYFIDNCISLDLQYDGFTTVLEASSPVIPGEQYTVYFTVADLGDGLWDSGLFIGSKSLNSSVNESSSADFNMVYPNPVKDFVFIRGLKESIQISIWDISGKRVLNQLYDSSSSAGISVSDLRPGVYFIEYVSDGAKFRRKIIKQ